MSDVDFWSKFGITEPDVFTFKKMKSDHDTGLYPPSVAVKWTPKGDIPLKCAIEVKVTGCAIDNELDGDIILPLSKSLGYTNTRIRANL